MTDVQAPPEPNWLTAQFANIQQNADRQGEERQTTMLASGQRLDLKSEDELAKLKKRRKQWQAEAWAYYDSIGEIWFAHQFVGNCLRRIRLYIGQLDPTKPGQPPTPLDLGDNLPDTPLAKQALVELDRLKNGTGGHGDMMFSFGLNLGVTGDCTLLGQTTVDQNTQQAQEIWKVYSNDQLSVTQDGKLTVLSDPDDKAGREVDQSTAVGVRVWRQHPRWDTWADSPMKALLDSCDELAILSRQVRSSGRSRMNAGLLVIPSEADLTAVNPTTADGRENSTLVEDLIEAMTMPIQDEGAASAVVPLVAKLKSELIEKIKHFKFDREFDKLSIEQRTELIRRIANGLDIPSEVLLGMADLNHWTAWQIDEQTFKAHIEPLVIGIVQALTVGFLWPALGGSHIDGVQDLVIWYDPSNLVGHPNRAQDTKDAHDQYLISDESARRYLGFSEEDAPSAEEIADRMRRKATIRITESGEPAINPADVAGGDTPTPADTAAKALAPGTGGTSSTGSPASAETVRPGAPSASGRPAGQAPSAVVAAGTRNRVSRLGVRLATIDSQLRSQLLTTTDTAVFRSVEIAGASIRRKIGRDTKLQAKINGVPNHLVAMTIGQHETLRIAGTPDLSDGLDQYLSAKYVALVSSAQARVRQIAEEYDPEFDAEQMKGQQDADRSAGLALLLAGATALATDALLHGTTEAPTTGEYDGSSVPFGLIRQSLARAGGAAAAPNQNGAILSADGTPVGGVATGDTALDIFNSVGLSVSDYTWTTGAPQRPFEPHADLDGVTFSNFDDDQLLADEGEFPFVDHYFPGDHLYCQCDFVLAFEDQGADQ